MDLPTLQELFDEELWWEFPIKVKRLEPQRIGTIPTPKEKRWPITSGTEITFKHYEILRRGIWLRRNPRAGYIDFAAVYGYEGVPLDKNNWPGSLVPWSGNAIKLPGQLKVYYKDEKDVSDLYINNFPMNEASVIATPPINNAGMLNPQWQLSMDLNKYHHCDPNAGRFEIGATTRKRIVYWSNTPTKCSFPLPWTEREYGYSYYPAALDPDYQVVPYKVGSQIRKRHTKVEIKRAHITKWPHTHYRRSIESKEECIKPIRLNEYVKAGGTPWRTDGPLSDPNPVDKLINPAYQDQVIHTCESMTGLVWPVTEEWKENFVHYNAKTWAIDTNYYRGDAAGTSLDTDIVYVADHNPNGTYPPECFYVCLKDNINVKPGVTAGWEEYWSTPAWNQEVVPQNISFPYTQDINGDIISLNYYFTGFSSAEYFDCNGSTFEFFLKQLQELLGDEECDWYWDSNPYVPVWMYKEQFFQDKVDLPNPRGCWRRCFRHTMGRFGVMMWPGSLGYPPGYWEGRSEIYKRLEKRFIVTQPTYDAAAEANKTHYRVVDVETLYDQAVIEYDGIHGEGEFDKLLSTHDPKIILDGIDAYEVHHDLVNHMRYILVQCRYLYDAWSIGISQYANAVRQVNSPRPPEGDKPDAATAWLWGRQFVDTGVHHEAAGTELGPGRYIRINGRVTATGAAPSGAPWTAGLTHLATGRWYCLVTIVLWEEAEIGDGRILPAFPSWGTVMFLLKIWPAAVYDYVEGGRIERFEGITIGVAGRTYRPPTYGLGDTIPPHFAFVGGTPSWEGWYKNGTKWQYLVYFWITAEDTWPPDSWFNVIYGQSNQSWEKQVSIGIPGSIIDSSGSLHVFRELDLSIVPASVFEDDPNNFIEVL